MPSVIPEREDDIPATRTIRGRVAIVGVSETVYYKHGQATKPEVKLALQAILAACAAAGIDPQAIDGFASYSNDRNDPSRLAAALGIPKLRFSNMQWAGGNLSPALFPRPSPQGTPAALPSPILRRLSSTSTRRAALCLAAGRSGWRGRRGGAKRLNSYPTPLVTTIF
jgi:hypothetical protein